jgi:uncharacterized protein (DUF427 family)
MVAEELVVRESVWDYPRPPRLEPTARRIRIAHSGTVLAESRRALRVLETSHPPVYYIPPADIAMQHLLRIPRKSSYCEFKGNATYWTIDLGVGGGRSARRVDSAAWSYEQPAQAYAALQGHLAFYANRVDECWVDEERVAPQPGDFYGGWITKDLIGPFKGAPGTMGW